MNNQLGLQIITPDLALSDFVDVFYILENKSPNDIKIASLPDGKIDLVFICSGDKPPKVLLMDLDRQPFEGAFPTKTMVFAVSFKLLALEYILETYFTCPPTKSRQLPNDFWDIGIDNLNNFEAFASKISERILTILEAKKVDDKKRLLFRYIYSSKGAMTVRELSEKSFWSSREINRYFTKYIGLSLKAYCNILRFKASLPQIKEGKFFPEQNFADQNHFIRDVKKYSGLTPKILNKNKNDRFVLLLDFPKK